MDFAITSDPAVRLAFLTGLAAIALTLLLVLTLVGLRLRLRLAHQRRARFLAQWRPLLMQSLVEAPIDLPVIARADWRAFFGYWNHLHESLRGDVKDRLNDVARAVGADQAAGRMLRSAMMRDRLTAIMVVGNLREASAWPALDAMVTGDNAFLALTAMRAMFQIDPQAAIPVLLTQLNRRKQWSLVKIAAMLREAGDDTFAEPLAEAALRMPEVDAPRLIQLLAALNCTAALPAIRHMLATTSDEAVIAACLPMMSDAQDLPLVREHLTHPSEAVRTQAILALGRIGMPGDEHLLFELLGDAHWWIRYRAAEALAALPFLDRDTLDRWRDEHPAPHARAILQQVLAERATA